MHYYFEFGPETQVGCHFKIFLFLGLVTIVFSGAELLGQFNEEH